MSARFSIRAIAALLVGIAAAGSFLLASRFDQSTFLWVIAILLSCAALYAGYSEPSARRVVFHPLLIMSPELVLLPVAWLLCEGFECAGYIGILMFACLFSVLLIALSFAGFLVRRFTSRPIPIPQS